MKKQLYLIRALSLAVSAAVFLCCCGDRSIDNTELVSSGETVQSSGTEGAFNLLYCATDSLNPYSAVTKQNRELSYLLFDSLVKVDDRFETVNVIAESVSEVKNLTCTVTLKQLSFSDGSQVTAADVVFSYYLAKASSTKYAYQLSEVISCTEQGSRTVEFKLKKNDPYFAALIDFPILKSGSNNLKNEDNMTLPPIGSGRYIFDNENNVLTANTKYYGGSMQVNTITLTDTPDNEAVEHNITEGNSNIYYTGVIDENIIRMSGKRKSVNLNNLIYIGVNMMPDGKLSNPHLRYAVSAALDREKIVSDAYYTNAVAATGIFNPAWEKTAQYQTIQKGVSKEIVVVNLNEIGYNSFDSNGYAINGSGNRIKLSVLVNSEDNLRVAAARLIAEQLGKAGIDASVTSVPYQSYVERLQSNSFDLYVGETQLLDNMDITALVSPSGSVAYGIPATQNSVVDSEETDDNIQDSVNMTTAQILTQFYEGQCNIGNVVSIFESELPLIPVCYRTGVIFYSNKIENEPTFSAGDIFFDIQNIKINGGK